MNREGHNNENTKRDTTKRAFSRFNKLISTTCYNCRRLFFPGKHVTVDYTPLSSRAGGRTCKQRRDENKGEAKTRKSKKEEWRGGRERWNLFMLIEDHGDRILISRRLRTRAIRGWHGFSTTSVWLCIFDRASLIARGYTTRNRCPPTTTNKGKYKYLVCIPTILEKGGTIVLQRSSFECWSCAQFCDWKGRERGDNIDRFNFFLDRSIN